MSTRGLLLIRDDSYHLRLANYIDSDSYPCYSGMGILYFLRTYSNISSLHACLSHFRKDNKGLHKDKYIGDGGDILYYSLLHYPIWYKDYRKFINNSVSCKWAYEINFNTMSLIVYKGLQDKPWSKNQKADERGYYPCKPVLTLSFEDIVKDFKNSSNKLRTLDK